MVINVGIQNPIAHGMIVPYIIKVFMNKCDPDALLVDFAHLAEMKLIRRFIEIYRLANDICTKFRRLSVDHQWDLLYWIEIAERSATMTWDKSIEIMECFTTGYLTMDLELKWQQISFVDTKYSVRYKKSI